MPGSSSALRRAFVGAASAWAAAIPAATYAASLSQATTASALFAVIVYAIGAAVCHQLPERSFHVWGRQLPVCARCTGIYIGAAVAALVAAARSPLRRVDTPARLHPSIPVLVAALPAAATLAYEWTTGVMPANWIRAATGVVLGAALAWAIVDGLAASPEVN